jgi:cation:H+ antiporter
LVIGLTIVAAGTSLPEVVASIMASVRGERDIAVGNVVGSNVFNLGCVLGLSGIIAPNGIPVSEQAIRFDMPVMLVVAAVCLPIFMTGNRVSRGEASFFLIAFVVYQFFAITQS